VALETLKIYVERDIVGHVRRIAPRLQAGLRKLGGHPLIGEARGVGLIGGLELVKDKATKASFDPKQLVGAYVAKRTEAHGLIVRAIGDTIAICPPMIIEEAQIDKLLDRLGRALDDTAAWLSHNG
jgi:4-aminobutyrate--pyruvate transaminase